MRSCDALRGDNQLRGTTEIGGKWTPINKTHGVLRRDLPHQPGRGSQGHPVAVKMEAATGNLAVKLRIRVVHVQTRPKRQMLVKLVGNCRLDIDYLQGGFGDQILEGAVLRVFRLVAKGNVDGNTETPRRLGHTEVGRSIQVRSQRYHGHVRAGTAALQLVVREKQVAAIGD